LFYDKHSQANIIYLSAFDGIRSKLCSSPLNVSAKICQTFVLGRHFEGLHHLCV